MKKVIIFLVCCIVMVNMLSACQSGTPKNTEQQTSTKQQTGNEQGNKTEGSNVQVSEPLEFTVVVDAITWTSAGLDIHESEVYEKWCEMSNTRITFNTPPHNGFNEKVNLLFASGDYPEVVRTAPNWQQYANEGYFITLNDYFDSPEAEKFLNEVCAENSLVDFTIEGNIYAIPIHRDLYATMGTMVRLDWLKNLGLKKPETLDEYREVLNKFTYDDPDGNGENDTYGMTARQNLGYCDTFKGAFDIDATNWIEITYDYVDGILKPQQTQEKYKEYLRYMRALIYEDKVLVPDAALNTTDQWNSDIYSGRVGMWYHNVTEIDSTYIAGFKKANPDWEDKGIEIDYLKPPTGGPYDGKTGPELKNPVATRIQTPC